MVLVSIRPVAGQPAGGSGWGITPDVPNRPTDPAIWDSLGLRPILRP